MTNGKGAIPYEWKGFGLCEIYTKLNALKLLAMWLNLNNYMFIQHCFGDIHNCKLCTISQKGILSSSQDLLILNTPYI